MPLGPDELRQLALMGMQQPMQAGQPSQNAVAPPPSQPTTKDFASNRNPKLLKALGPKLPRFTARKRHPAMGG